MNRAERRRRQKTAGRAPGGQPPSPGEAAIGQAMALGLEHHRAGRLAPASELFEQVLKIDPSQPAALHRLGVIAHQQGDNEQAARLIGRALAVRPDYADAHNNLGLVLDELGRTREAIDAYRRAIEIRPDHADAHYNLGIALGKSGKADAAIASFRRAIALKPGHAGAHNNLAELLEKSNQTEELRKAVAKARQDCPGHPQFALRQAQLLRRDGEYAEARAVLERETSAGTSARFDIERAYLLGELCDRLDDIDAAFGWFEKANRLRAASPEARQADPASVIRRIELLKSCFTADRIADWRPCDGAEGRPDPVFLIGFPRSGTTLLDTVLRSHAGIAVVEEKPAVHAMRDVLARLPGGDPGALGELDTGQLTRLRRAYFAELDSHLEPGEKAATIIDKLPLNIVQAGVIHRVFPQARFVFALRHPCDCVLSCFMRNFRLNDSMANFLDLGNAARLYDQTMSLWLQYRAVLPLAVHTVHYESLIGALQETLSPALDFLGLDWDENMHDYAATALSRGRIGTPSYHQVTQPLYTTARGRWQRYRRHLEPVLPVLMPWARRFEYDG